MLAKMRQSLFIRFLFSYMAVMLIPVISLYWLYTHETTAVMEDEIYNSVVLDQEYALSLLDRQIKDLYNTANQFQLTRGFRSYADFHSFYTSESGEIYGEIIEDLFTLYQMNPFAKNLFIYFPDMDCAFSTTGLHEIHTLIKADYQYKGYTPTEYLQLLDQASFPTVLKSQEITIHGKTEAYVTFIFPLFESFGKVAANAVFCVESHQFTDMFSSRISTYNTSTYIRDDKGQMIASYHPLTNGLEKNTAYLEQNFFTISRSSSETGWNCTTLLPKKQPTVHTLMKYGRNFSIFCALTLLFSFLIVCYMMRLNYHPIRQLKDKATGINDHTGNSGKTELETISYALDYLKEQNTRLNTTIIDQLTLIANGKLRSLLKGDYVSVKDFNSDCDASLHYSFPNFFAAIILFHKKEDLTEAAARSISTTLEQYFESNYIYHLEPDKLITINAVPDNSRLIITDAFCSILKGLNQGQAITATVGVGNITQNTTAIGRSFMEAQAAVDYRFVKGNGTVILYSDLCRDDMVTPYPYEQFERLNNALAANDKTAVSLQINDILSYLLSGTIPLFLARGICFDILRTIDENKRTRGIRQSLLDVAILQQLSCSDTARDTVRIIQKLLEQQADRGYSKSTSEQIITQIKAQIQKHCFRCDFSIQELSDTFHMLPPNLSALFKSQTGGNILDYVTDLRMTRAKKLLKTTDLNLNDISMAVGYYNSSSFIRRFKKHQGVTPGAYRDSTRP